MLVLIVRYRGFSLNSYSFYYLPKSEFKEFFCIFGMEDYRNNFFSPAN